VILAGDVGGTKTQLALYEPGSLPRSPSSQQRLPSRDFPSLEALIGEFLARTRVQPTRVVLGIAGPVVNNQCEATNLPWRMSGDQLGQSLGGARVTLMNDLVTTSWGLGELSDADLETLHEGQPANGNRALIAAGTGLGEALIVRDGERWLPCASEGGHADFGPRNPLEDQLLEWHRTRHGRVSYERILSGPGLADLFRFLRDARRGDEPADVAREFDTAADPAVVVTQSALEGRSERASLALELFCDIYGAEAGNVALKFLAVGGLFVGGGIAPKIRPVLASGRFTRAFLDKGRLKPVLEQIPVRLIRDENTSLWGAARVALNGTS
jgi:glucokinase